MKKIKEAGKCNSIDEVRDSIDSIDREILELFALRNEYINEIVKYKSNEKEVIAPDRKDHVIEQRSIWAKENGLNPDLFKSFYSKLIDENISKELDILKNKNINN